MISKYKAKIIRKRKNNTLKEKYKLDKINIICLLTKNNIRVTLTNPNSGDVIFNSTSGKEKFKSQQKVTTLAVKSIANSILNFILNRIEGQPKLILIFQGFNRLGQELILNLGSNFEIESLIEGTHIAFNGTRKRVKRKK